MLIGFLIIYRIHVQYVYVVVFVCTQSLLLQCTCAEMCALVRSFCHWCLCEGREVCKLRGQDPGWRPVPGELASSVAN